LLGAADVPADFFAAPFVRCDSSLSNAPFQHFFIISTAFAPSSLVC